MLAFNIVLHCINGLLFFFHVVHSKYILFESYLPDFACGKRLHATAQTQNFGLYHVAMDMQ